MPDRLMPGEVAYLYVIGHDHGWQKVGFSYQPEKRAEALRKAGAPRYVVHYKFEVPPREVRGIEALAHWILRERREKGEWFAVTPSEAGEAVRDAVARYADGERCPPRDDLMKVRKQIVCTPSWVARVERWRGAQSPIPSWAEAVRQLALEGIALTEEDPSRKPSPPSSDR